MEDKTPQQPSLTKKQAVFVDQYARHGNGTEAALAAYDTTDPASAKVIASRVLDKPGVPEAIEARRKTLRQALIDKGIDEDKIAEKVGELLEASDEEGNLDYGAIDKGLKHATTIFGVTDPQDQPRTQNTYNILFSAPVQERVREIEGEIRDILTKKKPNA